MKSGYFTRPLQPNDVPALCAIEHRAAQLFRDHGFAGLADEEQSTPEAFANRFEDAELIVGCAPGAAPVGYAAAVAIGQWLWLCEISVDPAHGRQGIGAALVMEFATRATARGLAGMGLSTFRDIPFNAPFYRSLGFRIVDVADAPPALRRRFDREVPPGVDPATRCLMLRA